MTADDALMEAWKLGLADAGWTQATMDRAEELLPTLVAAGYAFADRGTWRFTPEGVARAEALERQREQ